MPKSATRYVLWGWTSRWSSVTQPLRIASGSKRDVNARKKQFHADYSDALTGVYAPGDTPQGLILQVRERLTGE